MASSRGRIRRSVPRVRSATCKCLAIAIAKQVTEFASIRPVPWARIQVDELHAPAPGQAEARSVRRKLSRIAPNFASAAPFRAESVPKPKKTGLRHVREASIRGCAPSRGKTTVPAVGACRCRRVENAARRRRWSSRRKAPRFAKRRRSTAVQTRRASRHHRRNTRVERRLCRRCSVFLAMGGTAASGHARQGSRRAE